MSDVSTCFPGCVETYYDDVGSRTGGDIESLGPKAGGGLGLIYSSRDLGRRGSHVIPTPSGRVAGSSRETTMGTDDVGGGVVSVET